MSNAFCIMCNRKQKYKIVLSNENITVCGINFSYAKQTAYCVECGTEIYVPEINDANAQARETIYYSLKNKELEV